MNRIAFSLICSVVAMPAFATGGFHCNTTQRPAISVRATMGHVPGAPIVSDLGYTVNGRESTIPRSQVVQYWGDAQVFQLYVTDAEAMGPMFLLKTRVSNPDLNQYSGTIEVYQADGSSRTHRIMCQID